MEPIIAPAFSSDLQFCPVCGSVLPIPTAGHGVVPCGRCPFKRFVKEYDDIVEEFVIHFNSPKRKKKTNSSADRSDEDVQIEMTSVAKGPTAERQCPRCHHDTMAYTTRQTRSADEGQTVFYTCIACSFQDIEYS